MTTVACPHFDVSIRQRSKGQSAVAGAAYMSAEKLFSEYDQRTKNFCYKEKEIVAKGILLPPNAPREYADRQTLWNAVEASEKQWNAQLARASLWRCRENCLLINTSHLYANTAWNNSCPGA